MHSKVDMQIRFGYTHLPMRKQPLHWFLKLSHAPISKYSSKTKPVVPRGANRKSFSQLVRCFFSSRTGLSSTTFSLITAMRAVNHFHIFLIGEGESKQ